ncbi:hypothetical protein AB0C31_46060, partial [Actinoplanes philippinensis]
MASASASQAASNAAEPGNGDAAPEPAAPAKAGEADEDPEGGEAAADAPPEDAEAAADETPEDAEATADEDPNGAEAAADEDPEGGEAAADEDPNGAERAADEEPRGRDAGAAGVATAGTVEVSQDGDTVAPPAKAASETRTPAAERTYRRCLSMPSARRRHGERRRGAGTATPPWSRT